MKCDACSGRGFVGVMGLQPSDVWPVKCAVCHGRGRLAWRKLARILRVDRRAVRNVDSGRAKPATCARVFDAIPWVWM